MSERWAAAIALPILVTTVAACAPRVAELSAQAPRPHRALPLSERIDALRREHAPHIDELRRLEACGDRACASIESLGQSHAAHRRLAGLRSACAELGRARSLYVDYALARGRDGRVPRLEDAARDRVTDCRLVLDGDRILAIQITAAAMTLARLGPELSTAAQRYAEQGWISAATAARLADPGPARQAVRERIRPILRATGTLIPDDELFAHLAEAVTAWAAAVRERAGTYEQTPRVRDLRFERRVRRLYAAQPGRRSGAEVIDVLVHAGTWQVRVDGRGRVVRRTRTAEVVTRAGSDKLCRHRLVVAWQVFRPGRKPVPARAGQPSRQVVDRPGGRSSPGRARPLTSGKTSISKTFLHPPSRAARRVPRQGPDTVGAFVSRRIAGSDRSLPVRLFITDNMRFSRCFSGPSPGPSQ